MADLKSSLATIATAAVLATWSAQAEKASDFSDLINAGWAKVEAIQTNTRNANSRLVSDTQPILLAQAAVETDGNTYIAEVIQVDGTKKTVKYFRNTDGIIIPPPIVDGKLVDGSSAPDDTMRAKMAQKKILAKYDKGILLALAMVWSQDLISDAFKNIDVVSNLIKQWKSVSKEQIQKSLFGQYILILSGSKIDEIMKTTEFIAVNQLKLSIPEFNQMKKEAEIKAITIWKSTTGSKAIG